MNGGGTTQNDPALELYKLEYERGAIRYNDIYKALWANFSYMALVAGGILTFAGDRFPMEITIFLACLPLIFWFWASFRPLNKYGDKALERLSWIETIVNDRYDLIPPAEKQSTDLQKKQGLRHFTEFRERQQPQPRVRKVTCIFSIILHLVAIVFFIAFCLRLLCGKSLISKLSQQEKTFAVDLKEKPVEVKLTGIDLNELKSLLQAQEGKRIAIDLQEDLRVVKIKLEELKKLLEKTKTKKDFQTRVKTGGGKQQLR